MLFASARYVPIVGFSSQVLHCKALAEQNMNIKNILPQLFLVVTSLEDEKYCLFSPRTLTFQNVQVQISFCQFQMYNHLLSYLKKDSEVTEGDLAS